MTPRKKGLIAKGLARVSPKIAKAQKNFYSYDIRDDKNNKVGYAELERQKNGKVLYGNWINVDKKHRGKGHAQRAMDMLIREGKKDKYERFDLEVPGDSKDARHIYEKYGFKAGKKISDDDIWGGLTKMSRPLAKKGKIGGVSENGSSKERRKKLLKRIAIGAGVGLAAGGLLYTSARAQKKYNNLYNKADRLSYKKWDMANSEKSVDAARRHLNQSRRYYDLARKYGAKRDWAGRAGLLIPGAVGTAVGIASRKKKRSKRK